MNFSLTLYVRERIRTVRIFLESLNKNSTYEGHEVLVVADPAWDEPSDEHYVDALTGEGNLPLSEWFRRHTQDFPRLEVTVVDRWAESGWKEPDSFEVHDARTEMLTLLPPGVADGTRLVALFDEFTRAPARVKYVGGATALVEIMYSTPAERAYRGMSPKNYGYRASCDHSRKVINPCRGFNRAVPRARNDYVMTSMACDMYFAPSWDANLEKWLGYADIVVPRYVEPHPCALEQTLPIFRRTFLADYLYLRPHQQREDLLVDVLERSVLCPGVGILESPRHRKWSHAIGMTMTQETFARVGGFREIPHPESTDLFFDDAAGAAGMLKVLPQDVMAVHGTVYLPSLAMSPEVSFARPGWQAPKVLHVLRSTVDDVDDPRVCDRTPLAHNALPDWSPDTCLEGAVYQDREKLAREYRRVVETQLLETDRGRRAAGSH